METIIVKLPVILQTFEFLIQVVCLKKLNKLPKLERIVESINQTVSHDSGQWN